MRKEVGSDVGQTRVPFYCGITFTMLVVVTHTPPSPFPSQLAHVLPRHPWQTGSSITAEVVDSAMSERPPFTHTHHALYPRNMSSIECSYKCKVIPYKLLVQVAGERFCDQFWCIPRLTSDYQLILPPPPSLLDLPKDTVA
ncbi:hypothetical protein J6590_030575 [Homalodisca vitripennis]|nr:hypothetical protein J6590_030575 [Homalodisca vitripennis]